MRIGTLAQAGGTTARAVRHYHRLGLLPEPPRTPAGYRDYSTRDLVRLMRIRWLAGSGVPLGAIADVSAESSDVVDDLRALISGIEQQQEVLARKKARLRSLLADAEEGRPLSALPRPLASRLSELIDDAPAAARASLERERDHVELLALSGALPDPVAVAMAEALHDAESVTTYLDLIVRWTALEGVDPSSVPEAIEDVAALAASIVPFDIEAFGGVQLAYGPEIHDMVPDAAQRAVLIRIVHLMTECPS